MLDVLFEDNHLLIVNKPAGMLVHGDETGDTPLADVAKEYLKQKYNKPGNVFVGVVHRLDRPVSGVVVLAKTSKALARLNEHFKTRKTQKTYWAIVQNKPLQESQKLVHWLVKDSARNITKAFTRVTAQALESELSYQLLRHQEGHYLLQVNPVTGRSHQIRVQLATIHCPIAGDLKYGAPAALPDKSIALHARQLVFEHPTLKTEISVQAPVPKAAIWTPFRSK